MHKFNNSYYNFGIWISTSLITIIITSKSKPSFWLSTSLLTVITILEFRNRKLVSDLAQVYY